MISIDKIVQQLQQCKDSSITLPSVNDSLYVQKTAIEIRKSEMELLNNNFEHLTEANYTMDTELNKESHVKIVTNTTTNTTHSHTNGHGNANPREQDVQTISSKALIIYGENETANIPEIILKLCNKSSFFKQSDWYIYGVKNPESFYKSFLLLSKLDFIIKNKTEKKNEVATFKREMAMQYENYYKSLNYRKLRFPHHEMVHNLTGLDNYVEFDVMQFIADYSKVNYIVLDIINEKYIDVKYTNNDLNANTNNSSNTIDSINDSESINESDPSFVIIIKYAANTYLPLMNSTGNHSFGQDVIDSIISKNFERIVLEKYKEPKDFIIDIKLANSVEGQFLSYNIEDAYNIIDESDDTLHKAIDYHYSMSLEGETANDIRNINKKINDSLLIPNMNNYNPNEDMIDIEEQEEEPMGAPTQYNTQDNTQHNNIRDLLGLQQEPTTAEKPKIVKAILANDLESILSRVPMACDIKKKKTKKEIALELSQQIAKEKKEKEKEAIPNEAIPIEELLNFVSTKKTIVKKEASTNSGKEELKPIAKYNLVDLQTLAKLHRIDTQKMGNCDKKVNKLKAELYEDIKKKM
uniref:Uncharacterized protein n=1 Tax=viral metagenome TaxID=1070528 RepID=A0A6C0EY81_9ZZZZ